ncbi:MAG: sigma 54-interacting transcriptional regulator [Planctomycetota bacterium]
MNLETMQGVTLAIAGARETDEVLDRIARGVASCPNVALTRIWLIRSEDSDRGPRRWLQLAASAGNLWSERDDATRLDGCFSRFEIGERKIGRVAASGEGVLIPVLGDDAGWIADPAWASAEGIAAFAAQPLIARGEILGVIGLFDRLPISDDDFTWLRTFADHAAVSISTARAFQELETLRARLERDNAYLREEATRAEGPMLGRSPVLEELRRKIALVAPTEASVLIQGESGTGKELVAREIHEASRRRERPLVKVNCGAIPPDLFESEFFGHRQGAFTGATRDRIGRFELADGGTLFLDEVGEIPLAQQAKLLRVLQEGTFEPVGDETTRRVDVRVIAATNRDLASEVEAGRFRADLYYRLGVFPVLLPPLRHRDGDVIRLAEHFVADAARRLGVPRPEIPPAQRARLERYRWPGNVRELEHVVERAVILARGGALAFPDLEERGAATELPPAEGTPAVASYADLRDLERALVRSALEAAGGKISGADGAAARLGLPPSTLASKLQKLGLRD